MNIIVVKRSLILAVLSLLALLAGCMDELNLTQYSIVYPTNGAKYVGNTNELPPISDETTTPMNTTFEIGYKTPPSGQVNIVLNGRQIGQYFTYVNDHATADISLFKHYLRQGANTLSVEPSALGPSIHFNYDAFGPEIIISKGELRPDKSAVDIEGYLRDTSELNSVLDVTIYNIIGYQANGQLIKSTATASTINVDPVSGQFSGTIDVFGKLDKSLVYQFVAKDRYGFESSKSYIADAAGATALPIQNAVQVAIGQSLVQAMRPLIAGSIYKSLKVMPMDMRLNAWNDTHICVPDGAYDADGKVVGTQIKGTVLGKAYTQEAFDKEKAKQIAAGTANPTDAQVFAQLKSCQLANDTSSCGCNSLNDGATLPSNFGQLPGTMEGAGDINIKVNKFYLDDGTDPDLYGQAGTMLLNSFSLDANNKMHLSLAITNMLVDINIKGKNGIIVVAGDMHLVLGLKETFVDAVASVSAVDGKMSVQLDPDSTSITFGASPDVIEGTIWGGLPITGILDGLMPSIQGMIGDMTPGIINSVLANELQKVVIGGVIARKDDASAKFDAHLDVAKINTQPSLAGYDLYTALSSTMQVLGKDPSPAVQPMLGPVFVDDPVPSSVIDNTAAGSNLTVAVNTNLINQALNATFATGVTHLTLYNKKTYYGGNALIPVDANDASKTAASAGDTRIRLWPDTPPVIQFSPDDNSGDSRAMVQYDSATLYFDKASKDSSGLVIWKNILRLKVNFNLAVRISQQDQSFVLGADGPPVFQINEMYNDSAIQVPKALVQWLVDTAMSMGGSLIANQFVVLDFGKIIDQTLNGTTVYYLSAKDEASITDSDGDIRHDCVVYDQDGNATAGSDDVTIGTPDGKYDLVCQTIDMRVSTQTVGVKGNKGSNLFFQMTAEDKNAPPQMGLPNFDLDNDGFDDLRRDNCAPSSTDIVQQYKALSASNPDLANEVDKEGNPSAALSAEMQSRINSLLATRYGSSAGSVPTPADYQHYNLFRYWGGDTEINSANAGSYPWISMMYQNASQSNIDAVSENNPDGDRIGDLCEDDDDRDGIWAQYNFTQPTLVSMPPALNATLAGNPKFNASTNTLAIAGVSAAASGNDNCPGLYNPDQLDTKQPQGVGDACNVRVTYVLLRSYESQFDTSISGGQPMCLSHEGLINNNVFSATMHTMKVCDPDDVNQRWYMKAVNNVDVSDGVEFYTNETRNPSTASRLIAFGQQIEEDCSVGSKTSWTRVQELRLVNQDDAALRNVNAQNYKKGGGSCNETKDRGDPIWYPQIAGAIGAGTPYEETQYPWVLRTHFNFDFGDPTRNEGVDECITYAQGGWGVDIDSAGETYSCTGTNGIQMEHRWSIWAGGDQAPWNGVW